MAKTEEGKGRGKRDQISILVTPDFKRKFDNYIEKAKKANTEYDKVTIRTVVLKALDKYMEDNPA